MCFMPMLIIRCSIYEVQPFERYVTLIWPLEVIQGQMFWGKLIGHTLLPICVSNKLWSERAWFMKYIPLKTQLPWLALSIASKVKCYKVNWKDMWHTICIPYKLWSYDAPFMKHNHLQLQVMWHWFDLLR